MYHNPFYYVVPLSNVLFKRVVYWIGGLIPKSSSKVVMGAWGGHLFLDNPMYLLQYLLEHTALRIIWIGEVDVASRIPVNERVQFVRRRTFKAWWHLLTSKCWVCTHSHNVDLTDMAIPSGVCCINLWHGIPVKRLGRLQACRREEISGERNIAFSRRVYRMLSSFPREWLVVSSDKMVNIMVDGCPGQYDKKQILRTGTPRNDYLIYNRNNDELKLELKRKYGAILGFEPNKKIVLYFPTWREKSNTLFSFFGLPKAEQLIWRRTLDAEDAVLIEKYHHASFERLPPPQSSLCSCVVKVDQEKLVNAQEMLLMADILISDYSGAYIDFSLLQRPIIHFMYDFENYAHHDFGFSYDMNTVLAGKRVDLVADLREELVRQLRYPNFCPMRGLQDVVYYEQGRACELLTKFILQSENEVATRTRRSP